MTDNAVSASAKGATFLILLQIGTRALTFALNQVLLRFLSPELLGAALQLEVFVITAHHFARESLRVACQRHPDGGIQAAINLSYLAIAGGIAIVACLGEWYLTIGSPQVPYFVSALRVCQIAAVVELCSEPAFVAVQQKMLYKARAAAEGSAVVLKTLSTASLVLWARHHDLDLGVLPFAAGEFAYCSTLTVVYLWQTVSVASASNFSLALCQIKASTGTKYYFSRFSKPLVDLGVSLYVQSGIKYVLTQGDTFVSARFATLEDQGMYALSANYGGLIARMLLRPIEDSSRNLFAKLCSESDSASQGKLSQTGQTSANSAASLAQASSILSILLRFYTLASLFVIALGPTAAPLLLHLVAGSRWSASGAGEILSIYCYSIPLLAINGVSEAFVAAAASASELRRQSAWMAAFSAGFAISTWYFLSIMQLGAKGLVLANCMNMGMRILFNLEFATRYFRATGEELDLLKLMPNAAAISFTGICIGALRSSRGALANYGQLGELGRVGLIGAVFATSLFFAERRFLLDCLRRFRS